ncbi:hypothetical protein K435DRAFT_805610 [Dendrothele bispora CBS 962.96]|uniref:Uncharacterized protein n=1 Tax=Dendrothele bispora (strain CBS 962.96) TaxID=1314807 RepID=A0A4S8LAX9_DENBC|nr:hypothetical protein K435DRAFT_805610 [Dendrothele bispora CBS 962.96]
MDISYTKHIPSIFSQRRSSSPLSSSHYPWTRTADSLAITGAAGLFSPTFAVVLISTETVRFCQQPPKMFPKHLLWASPKRSTDEYAYKASSPLENCLRDEGTGRLNTARAELTKCRKCGQMRPENWRLKRGERITVGYVTAAW